MIKNEPQNIINEPENTNIIVKKPVGRPKGSFKKKII